jgi:hypothetical protein
VQGVPGPPADREQGARGGAGEGQERRRQADERGSGDRRDDARRPGCGRDETAREQAVRHAGVQLNAGHLSLRAERGLKHIDETRCREPEEDDLVLERRGIDEGWLPGKDLLFARKQVARFVRLVRTLPADERWRAIVDHHRQLLARPPRFDGVPDRNRHEGQHAIADTDLTAVENDFLRPRVHRQQRRANAERRQVMVARADERRHPPRAAVWIERQVVMAQAGCRVRQRLKRRDDERALVNRRPQAVPRAPAAPLCGRVCLIAVDGPLVNGIGQQHHRTRRADGFHQRRIRLLRRNGRLADLRAERPVQFEEGEVDGDRFGRRALQVVDEGGIHDARPRPAAQVRREIADGRVVEFDEDDVGVDRGGIRGPADAPVVGPELRRIENARPRQQEHESCGAETERDACEELSDQGVDRE